MIPDAPAFPDSPDSPDSTTTNPQPDLEGSQEPETHRVIAIANQKGGVGKSTTSVNLGAALAGLGKKVLVIDLDPQGNASTGLGITPERREITTYHVLTQGVPPARAVLETETPGLWLMPSSIDLAGAEIELVSQFSRETRLRRAVEEVADAYDFVIFDCPPSLGLLTVNALAAASEVIVPIQCEYYALEGLGQLLKNVRLVQQNVNPNLRLSGIVLTMYSPRTKLSEQVAAEVRRYFGPVVYDSIIPRSVRLSEAPSFGKPISAYDPKSRGAEAYASLAVEVLERPVISHPVPTAEPPAVIRPMGHMEPTAEEEASEEEASADEDLDTPEEDVTPEMADAASVEEPEPAEQSTRGAEPETVEEPEEEPASETVVMGPAGERSPADEEEDTEADGRAARRRLRFWRGEGGSE